VPGAAAPHLRSATMRPYQKQKTELNWLQWIAPLMYRDRSQTQPPFGLFFHVLRARSFALRLDSPESRMFPLLASALVPRRAYLPLTTPPQTVSDTSHRIPGGHRKAPRRWWSPSRGDSPRHLRPSASDQDLRRIAPTPQSIAVLCVRLHRASRSIHAARRRFASSQIRGCFLDTLIPAELQRRSLP